MTVVLLSVERWLLQMDEQAGTSNIVVHRHIRETSPAGYLH